MKRILFLLALFFTTTVTCYAQRIYFCENYTSAGDPINPGSIWTIKPSGGNVYILFQNGGKAFNANSIFFYIDYFSGSEYIIWDTEKVNVLPSYTWQVLDYKFTKTGSYRVSVWVNGTEITKDYVTITSSSVSTVEVDYNSPSSTMYYSGSSVLAGTMINRSTGYVYEQGGPFYLNENNKLMVYFKVSNGTKKLGTSHLIAEMYKMNSKGTYDFYATKDIYITDHDWVYFTHIFKEPGSYKVSVYNSAKVWINNAYITINSSPTSGIGTVTDINTLADNTYYSGSSVVPGTYVDASSGYVTGMYGPFELKSGNNKKLTVYFKVSNGDKKLNTTQLVVNIFKKNKKGNYEFLTKKYYNIKDYLNWVYFKYEFEEKGQYQVDVLNSDYTWINTAYVTIE